MKQIKSVLAHKWTQSQLDRRQQVESGLTVVANLHSGTDDDLILWAGREGLLVRIDRRSEWGNPFVLPKPEKPGDRDRVCDQYIDALAKNPVLLAKVKSLQGKVLACWCHPNRCHGNHLANLANQRNG
jgi:hypothetical protein